MKDNSVLTQGARVALVGFVILLVSIPLASYIVNATLGGEETAEYRGAVDPQKDFAGARADSQQRFASSLSVVLFVAIAVFPTIGFVVGYVLLQNPSFGGEKKEVLAGRERPEMTRSQAISARIEAMLGRASSNDGPHYTE